MKALSILLFIYMRLVWMVDNEDLFMIVTKSDGEKQIASSTHKAQDNASVINSSD
jgi:hypothetical protein